MMLENTDGIKGENLEISPQTSVEISGDMPGENRQNLETAPCACLAAGINGADYASPDGHEDGDYGADMAAQEGQVSARDVLAARLGTEPETAPPARIASDLPAWLYQSTGARLFRILPKTLASAVEMSDGQDMQTRFATLERAVGSNTTTHFAQTPAGMMGIKGAIAGDRCHVMDNGAGMPATYMLMPTGNWEQMGEGGMTASDLVAANGGLKVNAAGKLEIDPDNLADLDTALQAAQAAQTAANTASTAAQAAQTAAGEADAKAVAAQTAASAAQTAADTALADAASAGSLASNASTKADGASETASAASGKADSAMEIASAAQTAANTASTAAQAAQTAAGEADARAVAAQTAASAAQTAADTALADASRANGRIDALDNISELEASVETAINRANEAVEAANNAVELVGSATPEGYSELVLQVGANKTAVEAAQAAANTADGKAASAQTAASNADAKAVAAQNAANTADTKAVAARQVADAVTEIVNAAKAVGQIGYAKNVGDVDFDTLIVDGVYYARPTSGMVKHQPRLFDTASFVYVSTMSSGVLFQTFMIASSGEIWTRRRIENGTWIGWIPVHGTETNLTLYVSQSSSDINTGLEADYPVRTINRALQVARGLLQGGVGAPQLTLRLGEGNWGSVNMVCMPFTVNILPYDGQLPTEYSATLPVFSDIVAYLCRISVGGVVVSGTVRARDKGLIIVRTGYKRIGGIYAESEGMVFLSSQNAATNLLETGIASNSAFYAIHGGAIIIEGYLHLKLFLNSTGVSFVRIERNSLFSYVAGQLIIDSSPYTFTGQKCRVGPCGIINSNVSGETDPATIKDLPGTVDPQYYPGAIVNGFTIGQVKSAGDTMTGPLALECNGPCITQKNTYASLDVPVSDTNSYHIGNMYFVDKNDVRTGGIYVNVSAQETIAVLQAQRLVNGERIWDGLSAHIKRDGTPYCTASSTPASAKANEIVTADFMRSLLASAASGASLASLMPEAASATYAASPAALCALDDTDGEQNQEQIGSSAADAEPAPVLAPELCPQTSQSEPVALCAMADDFIISDQFYWREDAEAYLEPNPELYPEPEPEPLPAPLPDIISAPLPTEEQLWANLRIERNLRLMACDAQVNRLSRKMRRLDVSRETGKSEAEAIAEQIDAWDEYADALCALPDLPGAPWDGGGMDTPWPQRPDAALAEPSQPEPSQPEPSQPEQTQMEVRND